MSRKLDNDRIVFQIVKRVDMSKKGNSMWRGSKKVYGIVFKPQQIYELTMDGGGVLRRRINSEDKLTEFVFRRCGEGTYDCRLYLPTKKGKNRSPQVFVVMTLVEDDPIKQTFTVDRFETKGRKFGIFKRMVDWEDEWY